jgi:hypothetical protein
VAIDTNVFVHLKNPERNPDRHIHHLLGVLVEEGVELLVDDGGFIHHEYGEVISMVEGNSVDAEEAYLLQYFMDVTYQLKIAVDRRNRLMAAIREVIFEPSKNPDRTFVYVAFHQGKSLISNDEEDIVFGPPNERTPRRDRLLRETRRVRPAGAGIFSSAEASAQIP